MYGFVKLVSNLWPDVSPWSTEYLVLGVCLCLVQVIYYLQNIMLNEGKLDRNYIRLSKDKQDRKNSNIGRSDKFARKKLQMLHKTRMNLNNWVSTCEKEVF